MTRERDVDESSMEGAPPSGLPLANFFSLGAGELGARVVAFFAAALLARRLGTDGFGVLGFASAITSYLIIAPGVGLQDLAAREIAQRPADASRIAAGVVRVRLVLGLAGFAAVGALALLLPKPPVVRAVVALSALALLPLALNTGWAYKALERTRRVGAGLVLAQAVFVAGAFLFVHGNRDLVRVPIAQAVGELSGAFLLLPLMRSGWRAGSFREGVTTLRGAGIITTGRLLRAIIVTSDVVLLSFLAGDRVTGLYSAAYRVVLLLTAIGASARVVFLPALTRTHGDPAAGSDVLGKSLWLSWTVALPLVVGGAIVAPDLLALLFGQDYRAGGDALRLLLISNGLFFLHTALFNVFLVKNRIALDAGIIGIAAAVNVGLNLLLIPKLGILGTATTMVITEGFILGARTLLVARWGWRPPLLPLVKPLIAATVMAAVLLLLPGHVPVLARIAVGGLAYVAVVALVGGLPAELGTRLGMA